MYNKRLDDSLGQSLVEIVITLAIASILVAAMVFGTISSIKSSDSAKNQVQATKLAQEGIDKVRLARDTSALFIGFSLNGTAVPNWRSSLLWSSKLSKTPPCNTDCYFKIEADNSLTYIGTGVNIPVGTESLNNGKFQRVVMLSDDNQDYDTQKIVIVRVIWSDASGQHESNLQTILRKL